MPRRNVPRRAICGIPSACGNKPKDKAETGKLSGQGGNNTPSPYAAQNKRRCKKNSQPLPGPCQPFFRLRNGKALFNIVHSHGQPVDGKNPAGCADSAQKRCPRAVRAQDSCTIQDPEHQLKYTQRCGVWSKTVKYRRFPFQLAETAHQRKVSCKSRHEPDSMSVYIDLYIKQDKNQPSSQLSQFDPPTSMLLYGSVIGYRPIRPYHNSFIKRLCGVASMAEHAVPCIICLILSLKHCDSVGYLCLFYYI